jgi:DNA-directed RNA polymerase specialized sigma24 family protein
MPTSILTRTSASTRRRGPACASSPEVFQDPLVEDPPRGGLTRADRERQTRLLASARATCGGCPLRTACLYDAVVTHDVAGIAGGTTARQRSDVRRRLGVVVEAEDLDTLAGVVGARQVDHDEVLRLRRAHPDETLEQLAQRLGCSLSTVKRHLRRARQAPAERRAVTRPLPAQVLQVTSAVVEGGAARYAA